MKKLFLLFAVLSAAVPAMHADLWIKLDAAHFPDAEFRNYLEHKCKTSTTAYNANMYNVSTGEINVDAITEINLCSSSTAKSTVTGITVKYPNIVSLEGIKQIRTLKTLKLPHQTLQATFLLKTLDLSGMPNLEEVTTTVSLPKFTKATAADPTTAHSKFKPSLTKVDVSNCPKLRRVILPRYTTLTEINLEGSENILDLYLAWTGITKLDLSTLPNLRNSYSLTSDADFGTAFGHSNLNIGTKIRTLSLNGCKQLEELKLGNLKLNTIDLAACNSITELDLSGLDSLFRFSMVLNNKSILAPAYNETKKFCETHTHESRSNGKLRKIIMPAKPSKCTQFVINYGLIEKIDLSTIGASVTELNLKDNMLYGIDLSPLKKCTTLDLSFNRIHHLSLPPTTVKSFQLTDNCLTGYPQYSEKTAFYSSSSTFASTSPYQYVRVGKVRRYKIFDDPALAAFVETSDDTQNQVYYYAQQGGHVGVATNPEVDWDGNPTGQMEDPCYFYFDNDYADGCYFYRNFYGKNTVTHPIHGWFKVTLCRSDAVDFDPEAHEFYLTGDFNKWQPTEVDRFIRDEETGLYHLRYGNEEIVHGHFRVWDKTTESEVKLTFGGHTTEATKFVGMDNHVLLQVNNKHKMGSHPTQHFTTYKPNTAIEDQTGYLQPHFEMSATPGSADNYLLLAEGTQTGVDDIVADVAGDNAAESVLITLDGRVAGANPAPGLYIERRGKVARKVVVK